MKKVFLLLSLIVICTGCSSDDNQNQVPVVLQSHILEFKTGTLEQWVSVDLNTIVNLQDGSVETLQSTYNYDAKIISVEIPSDATSFTTEFYIEDGSETKMRFYGSLKNNIIHEATINQKNYNYDYNFE
jgi:uncharacterized protein YcfL